jgi:hypothetical protein
LHRFKCDALYIAHPGPRIFCVSILRRWTGVLLESGL